MEINIEKADGMKIETDDYELVVAKKRDDTDSNIILEFWFKKK